MGIAADLMSTVATGGRSRQIVLFKAILPLGRSGSDQDRMRVNPPRRAGTDRQCCRTAARSLVKGERGSGLRTIPTRRPASGGERGFPSKVQKRDCRSCVVWSYIYSLCAIFDLMAQIGVFWWAGFLSCLVHVVPRDILAAYLLHLQYTRIAHPYMRHWNDESRPHVSDVANLPQVALRRARMGRLAQGRLGRRLFGTVGLSMLRSSTAPWHSRAKRPSRLALAGRRGR